MPPGATLEVSALELAHLWGVGYSAAASMIRAPVTLPGPQIDVDLLSIKSDGTSRIV